MMKCILLLLVTAFTQPVSAQIPKTTLLQPMNSIQSRVADTADVGKKSDDIRRTYRMLVYAINRQRFSYPSSHSIRATLKDHYYLTLSEFRAGMLQTYTISLRNILTFSKIPDSTGLDNEAVHLVLKMKDSVRIEMSGAKTLPSDARSVQVIFTLANPDLIAEAEALLSTICRDNYWTRKVQEAKIIEETY